MIALAGRAVRADRGGRPLRRALRQPRRRAVDAPATACRRPTCKDILLRRKRPAYRVDDMADDLIGLLDALGLDKAHLVGASMGGFIAQTAADRAPRAGAQPDADHDLDGLAPRRSGPAAAHHPAAGPARHAGPRGGDGAGGRDVRRHRLTRRPVRRASTCATSPAAATTARTTRRGYVRQLGAVARAVQPHPRAHEAAGADAGHARPARPAGQRQRRASRWPS